MPGVPRAHNEPYPSLFSRSPSLFFRSRHAAFQGLAAASPPSGFFVLAFAISWCSWPLYAAGLLQQFEFLPIGPLASAVITIGLAEGRAAPAPGAGG
jgi:hypothetical protein